MSKSSEIFRENLSKEREIVFFILFLVCLVASEMNLSSCLCVSVWFLKNRIMLLQKTGKTPLRLCQDRQPIGLVDIVETAAIA